MMTHDPAPRMRSALLGLSLLFVPSLASAQAAPLPEARTLIAEYNKALGSKAAFDTVKSLHMSGAFEIPAAGMGGSIDIYNARPSKMALIVTIDGFGEVVNGSDGKLAWSINPQEGAKLLEGEPLAAALDDATFDGQFRDTAQYSTMQTLEKTSMDGRDCYKVKLVRKTGRESVDCYSVADHLLVATIESRDGAEAISIARDYKDFNGVKLPTKMVIQAGGMEQVVTISKVEINNVPATRFDPPAAIKALIK